MSPFQTGPASPSLPFLLCSIAIGLAVMHEAQGRVVFFPETGPKSAKEVSSPTESMQILTNSEVIHESDVKAC
jgi:hypothetical protein